jgi:hypothetical protein
MYILEKYGGIAWTRLMWRSVWTSVAVRAWKCEVGRWPISAVELPAAFSHMFCGSVEKSGSQLLCAT